MVFCDWLTIYQQHDPAKVADLNAGRVVRLNNDAETYERKFSMVDESGVVWVSGGVEYTTAHAITHEGSFDTSICIKAENGLVTLSGNVGRFNRPDNIFGYSVADCILIANRICRSLGLPEFTDGPALRRITKGGKEHYKMTSVGIEKGYFSGDNESGFIQTGAIITRIDLTKNYSCGNREQASKIMHYISSLHRQNQKGKYYGESGVTWGEKSEFWYAKLYAKYLEVQKQRKRKTKPDPRVVEFCLNHGLLRDEIGLKSKYLKRYGLRTIAAWSVGDMENVIYGRFNSIFKATEVSTDPFESLPGRLGELAVMWRNGVDLKARLPRNTFYRYRKQLKEYGVDISERCDISKLSYRVQVLEMNSVSPPDWYDLPRAA